jgi:hypothetical protein
MKNGRPSNEKAHGNVKEPSQFARMGLADGALPFQDVGDHAASALQVAIPKYHMPY